MWNMGVVSRRVMLYTTDSCRRGCCLGPRFRSLPRTIGRRLRVVYILCATSIKKILLLIFSRGKGLRLGMRRGRNSFSFSRVNDILGVGRLRSAGRRLFGSLRVFCGMFCLKRRVRRRARRWVIEWVSCNLSIRFWGCGGPVTRSR